jgi:hypothetical protein
MHMISMRTTAISDLLINQLEDHCLNNKIIITFTNPSVILKLLAPLH